VVERSAHNRLVVGSIPTEPTSVTPALLTAPKMVVSFFHIQIAADISVRGVK
jgi:hypothetical protein